MATEAIREAALALSAADRGRLAADLLASLEPSVLANEPAHATWLEELARRARRAVSGEEPGEPWGDVERRLRNELAE